MDVIRVLIIDDSENDYIITRETLKSINDGKYVIDWQSTYDGGLAAILKQDYDICFMDYYLGEKNGLDLLYDAINAGASTPIVMLTGTGNQKVDLEAMKRGAADYLIKKEIEPEKLERSLRYAIERAKSNLALQRSEERFRAFMDNTPTLAFMKDPTNGKYVYVNGTFLKVLDYQAEDIIGKTDFDLYPDKVALALRENDIKVINLNRSQRFLEHVPKPGHEDQQWIVFKFLFRDNNKTLIAGLAIEDFAHQIDGYKDLITLEMERQTYSAINSFVYGISHEIRSPAQAIANAVELITEEAKAGKPASLELIETIENSAIIIDKLTRNIINFGMVNKEGENESAPYGTNIYQLIMLDIRKIDLIKLIHDTINIFKCANDYKECPVEIIQTQSRDDVQVVISNVAVRHIILNLLSNALKSICVSRSDRAKLDGKILVSVTVGKYIQIKVSDNGRGIPEEMQEQIFNPFFRAHRDVKGTGLGLYLSKSLANYAKIDLDLEKSDKENTIFTLTFENKENQTGF